jgi:putative nucleotidyltransferase with HDIG domain
MDVVMRLKMPWSLFSDSKTETPSLSTVIAGRHAEPLDATQVGEEILQDSNVESEELGDLAKLPPFRPVVISLLRLFDRNDVGVDEISALVEADPSMASEMLGVVNSPLFGVQRTISSPAHAVTLLGVDRTKSLVATLAMRSLMQGGPRMPVVRRFWMHSIASATLARQFAPVFGLPPELCHVAALMHDLGRNGLLAAHQEAYARLALAAHENCAQILAEEQAAFNMTHCHAGALLAKAWNLPAPFGDVAAHHHDASSQQPVVLLVQLCCRLADDLRYQSIHRADICKPEETIAECVPERLQPRLLGELESAAVAIDTAINSLDF